MRRLFLPLATLILLAAAVLRLWQLATYPPGPHYDEAAYLLMTRSIAFGGARPFPIVEAYQGREVLYMYLNAPLLHLLGDHIFTLHLSSAFLNLLSVGASMALGRAMFRGRRGTVIGLVVGMLFALNFPQIYLGRQAFRAVTLPFCQSFALLFLWRGLNARRGGWRWLDAGGVFAGLALYTYMASRLFPLWLGVGGLVLLAADARRGWRLRQGALFFGVLIIVVLPMAIYAVQKPDIFMGRLAEVTQADQSITLTESVLIHARMLFIEGEGYLRYNIPGRPYLTLPEGLFMLVGIAVCARRALRSERATDRAAYVLALLSPLMVIPSVISVGGLPPNHMRSLGMIPLIFVLVAVGAEWTLAHAARLIHSTPRQYTRAFAALLIAILLLGGASVAREYFTWAGRADVYFETDADLAAAAAWLPSHMDENTIVYVAARDRGHPTVVVANTPPVTWLGTDSLFRAPHDMYGLYIFPRSAPPPDDWSEWLQPGRIDNLPLAPDGRPAFEAFRLAGDTLLPSMIASSDSVIHPYVSLAGIQTSPIAAGSEGEIVMLWGISVPPQAADFTPLVQLVDANGTEIVRSDVYITETDRWRAGEVLMQRVRLRVPPGTPPGMYDVRAAWVEKAANRYVPYSEGEVWARLGEVEVIRPSEFPDPSVLPIDVREDIDVQKGIRLLGYTQAPESARPGETLPLTLYWQAVASPERERLQYQLVARSHDDEVVLLDGEAVDGRHPATEWRDEELVTDALHVRLPRDLPGAEYTLELRVSSVVVPLGDLTVEGVPRVFEPPVVDHVTQVGLGDSLELYGYDLNVDGQGSVTLRIIWHARQPVEQDYTVFVHILADKGSIVAQRDGAPQSGAYPTSLWAEGEYVEDIYQFDTLTEGNYQVVAGLYSQETGERLGVRNGSMVLSVDSVQIGYIEIDY